MSVFQKAIKSIHLPTASKKPYIGSILEIHLKGLTTGANPAPDPACLPACEKGTQREQY